MTYLAFEIAKYIITYCSKQNKPISNLKLQKILYYLWIDYYKEKKIQLFDDEICAWQFGPVVPNVYYEFCSFAGSAIVRQYDVEIDPKDQTLINRILDEYIDITASELVSKTHKKDGPWDRIYRDGVGFRDVIPFDLIMNLECVS